LLSYGILWNNDTGIVVYLAWYFVIIYKIIYDYSNSILKSFWLIALTTAVQVIAIFTAFYSYDLYVLILYGKSISFKDIFEYQKLFYVSGFLMLPTKILHPWWCLAFSAAIGLACSLNYLYTKHNKVRGMQLFGTTILFCGLFSYYNGRSHDYTFFTQLISGFLLGLLIDEYYSFICKYTIKNKNTSFIYYVTNVLIYFTTATILFSSILHRLPSAVSTCVYTYKNFYIEDPFFNHRKQFLELIKNSYPGNILLLSRDFQGYQMAVLEKRSPLPMPSNTEMITKKDFISVLTMIDSGLINCVLLDNNSPSLLLFTIIDNYDLKPLAASQDKSLVLATIAGRKVMQ
jgi:hypothetical protein